MPDADGRRGGIRDAGDDEGGCGLHSHLQRLCRPVGAGTSRRFRSQGTVHRRCRDAPRPALPAERAGGSRRGGAALLPSSGGSSPWRWKRADEAGARPVVAGFTGGAARRCDDGDDGGDGSGVDDLYQRYHGKAEGYDPYPCRVSGPDGQGSSLQLRCAARQRPVLVVLRHRLDDGPMGNHRLLDESSSLRRIRGRSRLSRTRSSVAGGGTVRRDPSRNQSHCNPLADAVRGRSRRRPLDGFPAYPRFHRGAVGS